VAVFYNKIILTKLTNHLHFTLAASSNHYYGFFFEKPHSFTAFAEADETQVQPVQGHEFSEFPTMCISFTRISTALPFLAL
jgi:hypothetical protein